MKTFINWCNFNQGFLSFILSSLTIILSIIAMGISLRIGKIPYKRKLKIIPFAYCSANGKIFMEIIITNCGHSEIGIEHIKIMDNSNLVLGFSSLNIGKMIYIKPERSTRCSVEITDRADYIEENMIDLNKKIVITVRDVLGNEYEFKSGFPVG